MISPRRRLIAGTMLTAWSVLLTALTGVLGGVALRGLRLTVGSTAYWIIGLSSASLLGYAGWWVLGLLMVAMVTVIGLFSEFEERGHGLVGSSFGAVVITSLMLGGAFAFWVSQQSGSWSAKLLSRLETYLATVPGWSETVKIETKDVLAQVPSVLIAGLIFGLLMALLLQRRVMLMTGLRRGPLHRLSRFRIPEAFIWVLAAGLAGAFLPMPWTALKPIGINLLNVAAVVFYLQGLAVVSNYFETFRVGWFWQTLIMILLITQLFVLVSVIGLVDYWADFRARLAKRAEELDREIYKK